MKIFRVWFVKPERRDEDLVYVYWEHEKGRNRVTDLFCTTDTTSKAGRIVLAMRAMMRLDQKPTRPKIPGWRAVWSASQHKWQLVRSKAKATAPKKKAKKSASRGQRDSSSSGSLRDTDWHDDSERFRGPRGDTW